MPVIATLVMSLLVVTLYCVKRYRKSGAFPPGPTGLPLVGYLPFLGDNPSDTYARLAEKYGPVFSVQLAGKPWVVLNSYEVFREALVQKKSAFSGRSAIPVLDHITHGLGIVLADDSPAYRRQKLFGIRALRGGQSGKMVVHTAVIEELTYLRNAIESHDGQPIDCHVIFSRALANTINQIILGHRFGYDDERLCRLVYGQADSLTNKWKGMLLGLMMVAPFTRHLPAFRTVCKELYDTEEKIEAYLRGAIDVHRQTFDGHDIRGVIDEYLKEMSDETDPSFHEEQLIRLVHDLFSGGIETSASALRWCMLAFAHYPEYQERIAEEVASVIGEEAYPSMTHRDQMPWTCAFIHEILRHRTPAPLFIPHKTTEGVNLAGYWIPKHTTVAPNVWAIHRDPKHFAEPEKFRPERFLDSEGRFCPSKRVVSFGLGPRACVGEYLARAEMFLLLTGLVQKFRIVPDPSYKPPSFDAGVFGIVYAPFEFRVRFELR